MVRRVIIVLAFALALLGVSWGAAHAAVGDPYVFMHW